jgi:hypothetical protein
VIAGLVLVGASVAWIAFQVRSSVVWATAEKLPPVRSNAREIGVGFLAARSTSSPSSSPRSC